MEIEVKAKVLGMKNGHITELVIDDEPDVIFYSQNIEKKENEMQVQTDIPVVDDVQPKEVTEEVEDNFSPSNLYFYPDKGRVVARFAGSVIHSNVLKTFKEGLEKNVSRSTLKDIISIYRPELKSSSKNTYVSVYTRYILGLPPRKKSRGKYGKLLTRIKDVGIREDIVDAIMESNKPIKKVISTLLPDLKKQSVTKYAKSYNEYLESHKKKRQTDLAQFTQPSDVDNESYAYNKKYHRHIKYGEYNAVRRAITKWDFIATSENIANETGLSFTVVRSVLDYLLNKEKILIKTYTDIGDGKYNYVYFPKEKEE